MPHTLPQKLKLKTGDIVVIREATKADAAGLIRYVKNVAKETDFLTFGEGDFKVTKKQEEKIIREHKNARNKIFLIAELKDKIVGILNVNASSKPRQRHIGDFGVTVRKDHWGKGIGAILIQSMIDWAKKSSVIRKINLTVQVNNRVAIKLYKKFGFKKEGVIRRDAVINGKFYDAYAMGILIY